MLTLVRTRFGAPTQDPALGRLVSAFQPQPPHWLALVTTPITAAVTRLVRSSPIEPTHREPQLTHGGGRPAKGLSRLTPRAPVANGGCSCCPLIGAVGAEARPASALRPATNALALSATTAPLSFLGLTWTQCAVAYNNLVEQTEGCACD